MHTYNLFSSYFEAAGIWILSSFSLRKSSIKKKGNLVKGTRTLESDVLEDLFLVKCNVIQKNVTSMHAESPPSQILKEQERKNP